MPFNMMYLSVLLLAIHIQSSLQQSRLTEYEKTMFLESHNSFRATISSCMVEGQPIPSTPLPALKWDDNLARTAQEWSDKCIWRHFYGHVPGYSHIGQNMFAGTALEWSVLLWGAEHEFYNFYTRKCQPKEMCGHYTQVVWATTTHVGCAYSKCKGVNGLQYDYVVVCNYGPGGNVNRMSPYKAGTDQQCKAAQKEYYANQGY